MQSTLGPLINHDFRTEGLHLIGISFPLPYATGCGFSCQTNMSADKLYSSAQRMKHGGHKDENIYHDSYAPQNPGTDGQGSYFGDKPRSIINDRFRAITLFFTTRNYGNLYRRKSRTSLRIVRSSSPLTRNWKISLLSPKTMQRPI